MNAASPAPAPWTAEQLFNYLRRGYDDAHGAAAGPMASVVHNLSLVPERDVRAIALYVAAMMPRSDGRQIVARGGTPVSEGAAIYAGACATCHGAGGAAPSIKTTPLELTTSVNAPDPRNTIHIVRNGIWPQTGEAGTLMPGFASELDRAADRGADRIPAARVQCGARVERRSGPAAHDRPQRRRAMITLDVNGKRTQVDADPATPLLYVLRDDLALNGAKFGCGLGQCGACTVHGRRQRGVLLHHADLGRCRAARSRRSRAWARPTSPARCSARSSTSRRRNAATASPA